MTFLGFIIYSALYLIGVGTLIYDIFGVSPFMCFSLGTDSLFSINPFEDWGMLYQQFQQGLWAIDSKYDFALFLCFILFFPLWIASWFFIRHCCSFKFLKAPFHYLKRKRLEKKPLNMIPEISQKKSFMRPQAMPKSVSFGRMLPSEEQMPSQKTASTQTSTISPQNNKNDISVHKSEPTNTSSDTDSNAFQCSPEVKEIVKRIGESYGFQLYDSVLLGEYVVPLVLLKDADALLLTFLNDQTEWYADETISEDAQKPTWFSTNGLITSPVYNMTQAAHELQNLEPNSHLSGVVVLTAGSVVNQQIQEQTWAQSHNFVVCLDESVEGHGLITLEELLRTEKFKQYSEETTSTEPINNTSDNDDVYAEDNFINETESNVQENNEFTIQDENTSTEDTSSKTDE